MLGNVVNRHDAARLARKLGRGQLGRVTGKLRVRGKDRVVANWSAVERPAQEWWDIPAVHGRWNTFASGDPEVSFPQHVAATWLAGRPGLRALSLGCGTGARETAWARTGAFEQITGVDLSPDPIRFAAEQAKAEGLADVLSFRVADFRELLEAGERYDVVLGLHALHHFDRMDETMRQIAAVLREDGLLVFDEFVGPTKFQWTGAQLRAANDLLAALPAERRIQHDGRVKRRVIRPSLLSMRLDDPSEAVEAADLLPSLRRWLTPLEEHPYGGTVLHIALSGIAQNFRDDDAETAGLLAQCFAAEDAALPVLGHDFMYAVCSPGTGQARRPVSSRERRPA
jgi:2-polyprenyl-3-methyl-5-hydroxy-6-metoxy-1,4-benzoquinol methylase